MVIGLEAAQAHRPPAMRNDAARRRIIDRCVGPASILPHFSSHGAGGKLWLAHIEASECV